VVGGGGTVGGAEGDGAGRRWRSRAQVERPGPTNAAITYSLAHQ
jgi:hypothetical protein